MRTKKVSEMIFQKWNVFDFISNQCRTQFCNDVICENERSKLIVICGLKHAFGFHFSVVQGFDLAPSKRHIINIILTLVKLHPKHILLQNVAFFERQDNSAIACRIPLVDLSPITILYTRTEPLVSDTFRTFRTNTGCYI